MKQFVTKTFVACFVGTLGVLLAVGWALCLVQWTWVGELVMPKPPESGVQKMELDISPVPSGQNLGWQPPTYEYSYYSSADESGPAEFMKSSIDEKGRAVFKWNMKDGTPMVSYVQKIRDRDWPSILSIKEADASAIIDGVKIEKK